jgi:hypothetical protein
MRRFSNLKKIACDSSFHTVRNTLVYLRVSNAQCCQIIWKGHDYIPFNELPQLKQIVLTDKDDGELNSIGKRLLNFFSFGKFFVIQWLEFQKWCQKRQPRVIQTIQLWYVTPFLASNEETPLKTDMWNSYILLHSISQQYPCLRRESEYRNSKYRKDQLLAFQDSQFHLFQNKN